MKKTYWIILIVAIVVLGIVFGIVLSNKKDENIIDNTTNQVINEMINEEVNSMINEIEENVIGSEEENTVVENKIETTTTTETFTESPKTEEEKAIQIVKKDYGEADNIKISIEGMDETGRQIVVVRNATTTEARAFYFVNVNDNTFTKKEMN